VSAFLIRRLLRFVVVCIGVSLVTFSILHASGDPVALIMPEAPEADRARLRDALGLADPLPTQFVRFVTNAARGDFGPIMAIGFPAIMANMAAPASSASPPGWE